ARNSAYPWTTHWTSTLVACRWSWMAGSATLTTVPSMKAMLEPRMVAASTHRSTARAQGASAGLARMTPSSQGRRSTFTAASHARCSSGQAIAAGFAARPESDRWLSPFQGGAVPAPQGGARLVGALEEVEDRLAGRGRLPRVLVAEHELAQLGGE